MVFVKRRDEHEAVAMKQGVVVCSDCASPLRHVLLENVQGVLVRDYLECTKDIFHTLRNNQTPSLYPLECCDDDALVL